MNAKMRKVVLVSVAVVALLAMVPLTALANHVVDYSGTAGCEGFELHAEIQGSVQLYWSVSLERWEAGLNAWVVEFTDGNLPDGEPAPGPTWDYVGQWPAGLPEGEYRAFLEMSADDGSSWQDFVQGITLPCSPPTAVTLAAFGANAAGAAIEIAWETAAEVDTMGFNVYRAESADGQRTMLNNGLIASQAPGSPMGASYQFADDTARAGVTYHYWLQEVNINSETVEYGPVSAQLEFLGRLKLTRPRLTASGASALSGD